ncbi:hypothetical protein SGPA1_11685 [Streptomyces misionensis JCM 4497]
MGDRGPVPAADRARPAHGHRPGHPRAARPGARGQDQDAPAGPGRRGVHLAAARARAGLRARADPVRGDGGRQRRSAAGAGSGPLRHGHRPDRDRRARRDGHRPGGRGEFRLLTPKRRMPGPGSGGAGHPEYKGAL